MRHGVCYAGHDAVTEEGKFVAEMQAVRDTGGRGGIRTHGCLHIAGFQDRCIRPLCHPSGKEKLYRKFPSVREFVRVVFERSASNMCVMPHAGN